jgi:site-specific DNA-methyltransferase (cytosine-N4-specific)
VSILDVVEGRQPWEVVTGDNRVTMRDIPDGVVQCSVCSPPYYGLRDYGTGIWEGGDPACDHVKAGREQHMAALGERMGCGGGAKVSEAGLEPYRSVCGKCGAIRTDSQIGLEPTPQEFVQALLDVFAGVWRILRDDGTCWVNLGSSYANTGNSNPTMRKSTLGKKPDEKGCHLPQPVKAIGGGFKAKDLIPIPWMFAIAMQQAGWYLRDAITWLKLSPMPSSVTDRTTPATEMIFLFTKKPRYFYDTYAVRESIAEATIARDAYGHTSPEDTLEDMMAGGVISRATVGLNAHDRGSDPAVGRNLWNWWVLPPENFKGKHYAVFPSSLPFRCLSLGTSAKGCCPKCGKCWRRVVSKKFKQTGGPRAHISGGTQPGANGWEDVPRGNNETSTLGWEPGCKCGLADTRPCLVLDPFAGVSTTGVVARRLSLRYLGLELNGEYAEMGRRRIREDSPLFSGVAAEPAPSLFPEDA